MCQGHDSTLELGTLAVKAFLRELGTPVWQSSDCVGPVLAHLVVCSLGVVLTQLGRIEAASNPPSSALFSCLGPFRGLFGIEWFDRAMFRIGSN